MAANVDRAEKLPVEAPVSSSEGDPMKNTVLAPLLAVLVVSCAAPETQVTEPAANEPTLEIVAESSHQWTGVAVTKDGRVFVNFPRWSPEVPVSVAEVLSDGTLRPYPDEAWNSWTPGADGASTFVCVQSVVADGQGSLWVLDPANAWFQGVVTGGAKLVEIDAATGGIVQVINFDEAVAPPGSYLNDVRIDHEHRAAYITDSGGGALVVVDLSTGFARRVLDDHPSTAAEDTVLTFGGNQWLLPDGSAPQVHADGIAYDRANDLVYYQSLTGRTLYRISGAALREPWLDDNSLSALVETVAESGPSDGLLWDGADGIFISAIEDDAIKRWNPAGGVAFVFEDPIIAWPDSFALGADGGLYVTTSQIHRGPNPPDPYRVLRITGL
jgi:sugar lactone lactonase YvrE